MSTNGKEFFMSKTTIGVLVTMFGMVAQAAGWDIGDAGPWTEVIIQLAGACLAMYGRFVAVEKITTVAGLDVR